MRKIINWPYVFPLTIFFFLYFLFVVDGLPGIWCVCQIEELRLQGVLDEVTPLDVAVVCEDLHVLGVELHLHISSDQSQNTGMLSPDLIKSIDLSHFYHTDHSGVVFVIFLARHQITTRRAPLCLLEKSLQAWQSTWSSCCYGWLWMPSSPSDCLCGDVITEAVSLEWLNI